MSNQFIPYELRRGSQTEGVAEEFRKNAESIYAAMASNLDPKTRGLYTRQFSPWMEAKYDDLRRLEAREMRAYKIRQSGVDDARASEDLKNSIFALAKAGAKADENDIAAAENTLAYNGGSENQEAAEKKQAKVAALTDMRNQRIGGFVSQIYASILDKESNFNALVDQGLIDADEAEARKVASGRKMIAEVIDGFIDMGLTDHASAIVEALYPSEMEGVVGASSFATSLRYTPDELVKIKSAVGKRIEAYNGERAAKDANAAALKSMDDEIAMLRSGKYSFDGMIKSLEKQAEELAAYSRTNDHPELKKREISLRRSIEKMKMDKKDAAEKGVKEFKDAKLNNIKWKLLSIAMARAQGVNVDAQRLQMEAWEDYGMLIAQDPKTGERILSVKEAEDILKEFENLNNRQAAEGLGAFCTAFGVTLDDIEFNSGNLSAAHRKQMTGHKTSLDAPNLGRKMMSDEFVRLFDAYKRRMSAAPANINRKELSDGVTRDLKARWCQENYERNAADIEESFDTVQSAFMAYRNHEKSEEQKKREAR